MTKKKAPTHIWILAGSILVLGLVAWSFGNARDAVPGIPVEILDREVPTEQSACEDSGGNWNPCASACPDAGPDEVCIQVCVERCEF